MFAVAADLDIDAYLPPDVIGFGGSNAVRRRLRVALTGELWSTPLWLVAEGHGSVAVDMISIRRCCRT